jgi:hydrogenase large subunit
MAKTVYMPMNRVEGDLEVKVTIEDGVVSDAWMIGSMYRGLENMLIGRNSLDGLVITPRICGICSTSHLLTAAMALENITGTAVSPNGLLVRNIALGAEKLQSDLRHIFLMFTADLTAEGYADHALYPEIVQRYQPFQGSAVVATILATKKIPEIIAILGGQWPHSSFIVPGGITSQPSEADLRQCRLLLSEFRRWYEQRVLGCPMDRFAAVVDCKQLEDWLDERPEHRDGELGFFLRCGQAFGLDRIGKSHDCYLSGPDPAEGSGLGASFGGFLHKGNLNEFDQQRIAEQVKHARYQDRNSGGHPAEAETHPQETIDPEKYSWCKAPRYNGFPSETGALAEALIRQDPLLTDLVATRGASALARALARLLRPAHILRQMEQWLGAITTGESYYQPAGSPANGSGFGLVQAPRGLLGHWVQLNGGYIDHYQVITPTSWNASPRDDRDLRGPIEEALMGTPIRNPEDPVEVGHVVRSFDLCMVCSVHAFSKKNRSLGRLRLGI